MVISGVLAAACFAMATLLGGGLLGAAGLAFAAGFGLPRWGLSYLKKRREKNFLKALPDAVDVIVRGIKAGLPLFESIKVVAADAPEPLRGEFLAIIETQAIGMPLGEACARLFERMPVPEANFFGIVIAIQQKSGGNRGPGQPVQGAARSQEDGREDSGHVDGSQGVRGHHRFAAAHRHAARLPLDPRLYLAAVDSSDRSADAGRLRNLDVHRHLRDEENDQLRLLTVQQ
jgi:Type II secretion system (T2SS), protein F